MKEVRKRKTKCAITYTWNLNNDTSQYACETKADSHSQQTDAWLPAGEDGGGQIGRVGLCVRACTLGHARLFATPWTVAHQAALSMGFPRQEYWSRLPFPPPGDPPDPGIALRLFCLFITAPSGKPEVGVSRCKLL